MLKIFPFLVDANCKLYTFLSFIFLLHYLLIFFFRVLLQTFTSSDYVVNSDYLSGDIATDLKTLERLGYDVIPLNSDQWSQLLHPEKIPFLMREIHQKLKVKSC